MKPGYEYLGCQLEMLCVCTRACACLCLCSTFLPPLNLPPPPSSSSSANSIQKPSFIPADNSVFIRAPPFFPCLLIHEPSSSSSPSSSSCSLRNSRKPSFEPAQVRNRLRSLSLPPLLRHSSSDFCPNSSSFPPSQR